MNIVKVLGVLIPKKYAAVSVVSGILSAPNPKRYLDIPYSHPLDQGDVVRTPHLGLIIADSFI
jgi:hypothetical protein